MNSTLIGASNQPAIGSGGHPPRRWKPSPMLWLAIAASLASLPLLLIEPHAWRWALALFGAGQALICAACVSPRSQWLGPNLTALRKSLRNQVALTFDDGPDPEITPKVLDILDRYGASASFFCIAERAEKYPGVVREIVRRGHFVENHSFRHSPAFAFNGPAGLRAEIVRAQEVLCRLSGRLPIFFRAPAGMRTPFLEPVLAGLGLHYAAWTRRGFDTVTRNPQLVLRRLLRELAAGDVLMLHDGHAALTVDGVPVVLEVLPQLLDRLKAQSLRAIPLTMGTSRSELE